MKHFLLPALIVGLMGCHTTSQPTRPASSYRTIQEIKKDVGKAERIIDKAIKQGDVDPKQAAKQSFKWFAIVIGGTILITLAATQACCKMRIKTK